MPSLKSAVRSLTREAIRSPRGSGLFALALISVLGLGALAVQPPGQVARDRATAVLTPAQSAAARICREFDAASGWLIWNHQQSVQNQQLRAQNRRLAAQVAALQSTQRENSELRAELGLRAQERLLTRAATVIGHDPDGLGVTLTVDAGSRDGVAPGMAVVAGDALIGVVSWAGPSSAIVATTESGGFAVGVRTASSGLAGSVRGGGPQLPVRLTGDGGTAPEVGEGVVTSGPSLPAGIPLGRLNAVSPGGLSGEVTPFSDPDQAMQVLVVRGVRP